MTNDHVPPPPGSDLRTQVSGPATGLLVTGIIGGVTELSSLVGGMFGISWLTMMEDDIPEQMEMMFHTSFWMASALVGLMIAAFLIFAWSRMKDLQSWGLCVAASILAIVPCISPCCLVGLPIGIWCLVVLSRPEVKASFR